MTKNSNKPILADGLFAPNIIVNYRNNDNS